MVSLTVCKSNLTLLQLATDPLLEQTGKFVRVITTILHPQIYYKTLRITQYTTVYEVIVKLVGKYTNSTEDQNPDVFYITEVSVNMKQITR